jgi:glucose-1-phosphate thymidylyltransferase
MNFAILDAAAGPVRESGLGGTSRYVALIANVPLIWHVFDELPQNGVERALIIARSDVREELERILDGGKAWGVEVVYARAPDADGEQTVLSEASRALSSGPVLVCPADSLFPGQIAAMGKRFSEGDVDGVLLACGSSLSLPASRAFPTPVMLGTRTQELLHDSLARGLDGRSVAEILLTGGCHLAVCEAAKHWCYSDSTDHLLAANRMLLDALAVPELNGTILADNQVHGRVAISASACVSNSTLYGPVVIDEDAIVEDSFIGPNTAIGRGATVSGSELDNTMVLPFAEVRHPGLRIEASIIGERASVSRSFELPKGLHLRLTPGSRVTLS